MHDDDDDERNVHGDSISAYLLIAGQTVEENAEHAEKLYLKALEIAETLKGSTSPITGLVLLELVHFYEGQNRSEEADAIWNRLRLIFLHHFPKTDGDTDIR